jgi:hypothetical protein
MVNKLTLSKLENLLLTAISLEMYDGPSKDH